MSAITFDWTPPATEAPTGHSANDGKKYSREEEFRSALDSYIADYADYQKRLAKKIGSNFWRRFSFSGDSGRGFGVKASVCTSLQSQVPNDNADDISDLIPPDTVWLGG